MKYLLLTCVLLLSIASFSQDNFTGLLLKMDKDIETHNNKFPEERVGLFTDKGEYFSRENILFSTFLTLDGKASPLSKTLYLEFGDQNGKVLEKRMLAVNKGMAQGLIPVSPDWPSGAYVINAYTLWMKNTPQLIAQKPVFIIGKDYVAKPFVFQTQTSPVAKALLVPEGKSWVSGVLQNVVLRLADKNDLPLARQFVLLENGVEAARGQTDRNGFFKFQLTPKASANYTLKTGENQLAVSLAGKEGVALSFNTENKSRIFVNLQKAAVVTSNQFLLVGYNNEKVCYQSVFDFKEGATATAIAKSKLPRGLLHFLLFDEALNVVAQRDVFLLKEAGPSIENPSATTLKIKADSIAAGVVAVQIAGGETVFGWSQNYLPLLPELQNSYAVQVPDLSAASLQAIDNLLIVQPALLLGKPWSLPEPALQYPVESGITLRGNIKPYAGTPNAAGYKAEMIVKGEDSTTAFVTVQTQPNGEFVIPDLSYQQGARVFFQGNNKSNSRELLNMQLYPGYFDTLSRLSLAPLVRFEPQPLATLTDKRIQDYFAELDNDPRYKSLDAVIIKTKKRSPLDSVKQVYLTPLFDDGNARMLQPEGNYITIWHFLRNSVPGLKVEGGFDNPSVSFSRYGGMLNPTNYSGEDIGESFGEQAGVLFFLNEVQVSKDVISTLSTDDVALIAVNPQPSPALGAYNGYIAFFTKKGVNAGNNISKAMAFEKRKGYASFVSPYRVEEAAAKPGTTVFFGVLKPAFQLTLPAGKTYNYSVAGWNAANELVVETK